MMCFKMPSSGHLNVSYTVYAIKHFICPLIGPVNDCYILRIFTLD